MNGTAPAISFVIVKVVRKVFQAVVLAESFSTMGVDSGLTIFTAGSRVGWEAEPMASCGGALVPTWLAAEDGEARAMLEG